LEEKLTDSQYILACTKADIPQGKSLAIELRGNEILLCHSAEGFFAVDNLCSHALARLCDGKLKGNKILCPLHGAAFDIRDGSALSRPAVTAIASYAVRVEKDDVLVCLEHR
jgi:3-phenylpropionate/trans-cinnamate dioxygenase ferredoxin subunit